MVQSTPPNSIVVGVSRQVVMKSTASTEQADLEHGRLPDTIGETLAVLIAHVESLEKRVNGGAYDPALHSPEEGIWHGGDFSI
ncbi:MAG TPA: hypothetical protein VGK56_09890 [Anaerolineales bacterium]